MSRNLKFLGLRKQISKRTQKQLSLWKHSVSQCSESKRFTDTFLKNEFQDFKHYFCPLDLSGSDCNSLRTLKANQNGFAQIFLISLLPLLMSGLLVLLFSQFLTKNWMQSLHICRSELLEAQKNTKLPLKRLMELNPTAFGLRRALLTAQAQLALAIATENPVLAHQALREIHRLKGLQKKLDFAQKSLIFQANSLMARGPINIHSKLRKQNQDIQKQLPSFFSYQIHSFKYQPTLLAVKPDRPDLAPVYELKNNFSEEQSLYVSWKSEFRTHSKGTWKWIQNQHVKKSNCGASLQSQNSDFQVVLKEVKFSLRQ